MNRSIRYSKISTLNQLRNERGRLESDITNKELLLNLQYREITEYFSIANMISIFVTRINSLTPLITWAQSVFSFIRSLLRNDEDVIVDETIAKPNETKRKGQNRAKSIKKEKLSETEQPNEKQSVKKSAAKRPARSKT